MGSSRIKSNPATVFDVFVELCSPSASNSPVIVWKYPEDYFEEKILKHVVEFAFPCRIDNDAVQLFSFVLTNVEGKYTFGYCRHAPKTNTCLCFLSALPWSEFFYKLLNQIASLSSNVDDVNDVKNSKEEVELLLVSAYHQEIPAPGELFVVETSVGRAKIECICPNDSELPKIPDNRHLTEYYNAVDEQNMIAIWASMLCERRITMISSKLGRLTSCILAANLLIYPMHWQHIFIPVLPERLFNYLHAPMPFLIGVPSVNHAKAVKEVDMSDLVTLNIDTREFRSPYNDVASLPGEVISVLKKNLRNSNQLLGDGVSRAFLRALVVLIGGYREALQFRPGESILFSPDSFILSRPSHLRLFLAKMLELQIFRQFIEDKLENLNSGFDTCLRDEFEHECSLYSGKEYGKFKTQYNEWFSNMKKEGGALMKQIKSKVRTKGKEAMKDFREMFSELKDDSGASGSRPGSSQKIFIPSTENSPSLVQKLTHKTSTGSLTKLQGKSNSKLLISLLDDNPYLSSESIDKISHKSDGSIERRLAQKKLYHASTSSGGFGATRHMSILKPGSSKMRNKHTLAHAGSQPNSRLLQPASSFAVRSSTTSNRSLTGSTSDIFTPTVDRHQSLVEELRSVFSQPTEILSRLEAGQAGKVGYNQSNRGADFVDIDSLDLSQNKIKASKSVDSLLSFTTAQHTAILNQESAQMLLPPAGQPSGQNPLYAFSPPSVALADRTYPSTSAKDDIERLLIDLNNPSASSSSSKDQCSSDAANFDPLLSSTKAQENSQNWSNYPLFDKASSWLNSLTTQLMPEGLKVPSAAAESNGDVKPSSADSKKWETFE